MLDKVTSGFSSTATSSLVTLIKNALNHANLELANKMTGQEITKIVRPLETDDFTEHNRNIIAENLIDELKINSNIKTIVMEGVMIPENDNEGGKNA